MESVISVDLGQSADYTAIGVAERLPTHDVVRHLERPELGTPYPAIARRVRALQLTVAERTGRTPDVLVDATGVGRPVVDQMREEGVSCMRPVLIVTGAHVTQDKLGFWHVPKAVLVASSQVALQNQRLRIPSQLPLAAVAAQEMRTFQMRQSAAGNMQFEAWRSGEHDDLVLMLAQLTWWSWRMARPEPTDARSLAEREREQVRANVMRRVREDKRRRERLPPWRR